MTDETYCDDCNTLVANADGVYDCACHKPNEPEEKFITILDLAEFRGVKEDSNGSISMGQFMDVGLPFMGGCEQCGASCAAYNMCPTKTGNCYCLDCIHPNIAFETAEEANRFCFPEEYAWLGPNKKAIDSSSNC